MATKTRSARAADEYLKLVEQFPLRRFRSNAEHQQAKALFRRLSSGKVSGGVRDYLDVLIDLIRDYERRSFERLDTSDVSAAQVVRHVLTERSISISACARAIGMQQGDLSNMLSGKRNWSKSAIVRLADFLGLEPALFLRDSDKK